MEASKNKIKKIGIFFSGTREELNKIETKFQWLKMNFGLKKMELYKKKLWKLLIKYFQKIKVN